MGTELQTTNGRATVGSALANSQTAAPAAAGAYAIVPQTFSELQAFCTLIANSDLAPKDFKSKPGNVLVAVQMGAEVGLKPMQAIQNIAVVNGRPSVWGDAALAIVRAHPAFRDISEKVDGTGDKRIGVCTVVRNGQTPVSRTFSVEDAKKAGLWNKSGPWQQYPDRMLQMRARGFALRDAFPDALKGLAIAEEVLDIETDGTAAAANNAALPPTGGATRTETTRSKIESNLQRAGVIAVEPAPSPEPAQQPLIEQGPVAEDPQLENLAVYAERKGVSRDTFESIVAEFGGRGVVLKTQLGAIQQTIDDAAEGQQ